VFSDLDPSVPLTKAMLLCREITKSQNPEHRDPRISRRTYHGLIACEVTPAQNARCDVKRMFAVMMCASGVRDGATLAESVRACSGCVCCTEERRRGNYSVFSRALVVQAS